MSKPAFDPNAPFEAVETPSAQGPKPAFDPNAPFEAVKAPKQEAASEQPQEEFLMDEPEKEPTTSAGRAALVGAGQGATFGFAEELTSPFAAGAYMMNNETPEAFPGETKAEKFIRLMDEYKKVARGEQQAAQSEHPGAYLGGAVAGGMLIPGLGVGKAATAGTKAALTGTRLAPVAGIASKVVGGAAEGATQGALTGAGESEGGFESMEGVKNRLQGAEMGGELGAAIGGGIPLAGKALETTGKALKPITKIPIVDELSKLFKRGTEGQDLITKGGRQEAEDIVRTKAGQLVDDVKDQTSQVGKKIGEKIDEASASGTKVDVTEEVKSTMDKLQQMKNSGSKDSRANAAAIEEEIKAVLGIKNPTKAVDEFANGPEGLIKPKVDEAPATYELDPKQAQELKKVLEDYAPQFGMDSSKLKSARAANELSGSVKEKLNETTGLNKGEEIVDQVTGEVTEGPSINKQFSDLKKAQERLGIDLSALPNDVRDKVTTLFAGLEKSTVGGGNKREILKDVIAALKQSDPAVAAKYEGPLMDAVERLDLAQNTVGGGARSGLFGTTRAAAGTAANAAGLGVGMIKNAPVIKQGVQAAQVIGKNAAPVLKTVALKSKLNGQEFLGERKEANEKLQPHEVNKKIAQMVEKSDPETLTAQADQIREQFGEQGNGLATILDNMAKNNKPESRRALMFSVLQNPAYKHMLGLGKQDE